MKYSHGRKIGLNKNSHKSYRKSWELVVECDPLPVIQPFRSRESGGGQEVRRSSQSSLIKCDMRLELKFLNNYVLSSLKKSKPVSKQGLKL